jgi:hypothetical protein
MTVNVNTGVAGTINGAIAVDYFSAGTVGGVSNGLAESGVGSSSYGVSGVIQSQGQVIDQAVPLLNTASVNLGSRRVGDSAPSQLIGVTNQATGNTQAALNASIGGAGAVTASGSFNLLAPGATNATALRVGISTASAGVINGSATVAFVSDASNVGNCAPNCQLNLASQNVNVSGTVYTPAVAQVNTTVVDFGVVHKGDTVSARNVSVTNAAPVAAPNDDLRGSLGGASGPFTASGSLAGVAAQATDNSSLNVALNTANAGVFNGSASASFVSHNDQMSDLNLGGSNITLQAQINNFADLALAKAAGDGSLTFSAGSYRLDFGSLLQGTAAQSATLSVLNIAAGPADVLNGSFAIGAGSFALSGFDAFSGIAAGGSQGGIVVSIDSAGLGDFTQTVTIVANGSNASGFVGALPDTTLVLHASVVAIPEPGTYALMAGGLLVLWLMRRRQLASRAARV